MKPIELFKGADLTITVTTNENLSAATEVLFYVDTEPQIKKSLTGAAEATEARYWMYLNSSKFAVWQDGGATPIAIGSTTGTNASTYAADMICQGNVSNTSVMQCGQIVGGRVTTA